jgi:hypothetical protein
MAVGIAAAAERQATAAVGGLATRLGSEAVPVKRHTVNDPSITARPRLGELSDDPLQHTTRSLQVRLADPGAEQVGPLPLGCLDGPEGPKTLGREPEELRPAMIGVVLVYGQAVPLQQVRDTLDALSGESQRSGDPGHGHRPVLDTRHDLPSGTGLACRSGHRITCRDQQSVQLEDPDDKYAQSIAGWRASRFGRSTTRRGPRPGASLGIRLAMRHDSILSYPAGLTPACATATGWRG